MSQTASNAETMLEVTVNKRKFEVPDTITTREEFLKEIGYTGRQYRVFRIDGCEETRITSGLFVFDDGDEFVVIPQYVGQG